MHIARYGGIQCVWFTAGMVVVANNNNVISPYDRDGKNGQNGHHDRTFHLAWLQCILVLPRADPRELLKPRQ
jgi:hypothetical protein